MDFLHARKSLFRRVITVAAGVVVTSALISCGTEENSPNDENSANYPVTVSTSSGDTVIASEPQRIVTLQNVAFENVVALEKTPTVAAVPKSFNNYTYYDRWKDEDYIRTDIKLTGDVDVESIAKEKPDLIIAPAWPSFTEGTVREKLESIAPTLLFDTQGQGPSWKTGLTQVAEALNASQKADSVIAKYDGEVETARDSHPGLTGRTYDFGLVLDGNIVLSGGAAEPFSDLGLTPSTSQSSVTENGNGIKTVEFSRERFGEIAGDRVYLTPSDNDANSRNSEEFSHIKGQIIWDDGQIGNAVNNSGPIGHLWLPSALADALTAG